MRCLRTVRQRDGRSIGWPMKIRDRLTANRRDSSQYVAAAQEADMTRFARTILAALISLGSALSVSTSTYAADLPTLPTYVVESGVCAEPWVLRKITSRFRHQVRHVPHLPDVAITDFQRIHEHRYLPASEDRPIGRRYCGATVILSDGTRPRHLVSDRGRHGLCFDRRQCRILRLGLRPLDGLQRALPRPALSAAGSTIAGAARSAEGARVRSPCLPLACSIAGCAARLPTRRHIRPAAARRADWRATCRSASGFDFYVLSLSWSPSYCEAEGKDANRQQCAAADPMPSSFTACGRNSSAAFRRTAATEEPDVGNETAATLYDLMPSAGLIRHQWRKHGSCAGLSQERLFLRAARGARKDWHSAGIQAARRLPDARPGRRRKRLPEGQSRACRRPGSP